MNIFNYIFKNEELPRWIVLLNYACLSGIFIWPIIVFASVFMFDNPSDENKTYVQVILIDSYPLLLMLITFVSFKIFRLSKLISAMLPSIVILAYVYIFFRHVLPGIG
ncbi:MAG: hypothetical protein Q8927_15275 [Bacteroidota bacterium]|nr:hypothetical protein [Bacteroidota bacterium]MDP4247519.1 hypothetical protein [Bacteroidota bacterium]MDP4254672.1 hypothetical protein [Bacteroidota bacterium]MDP4260269.1 hypothetical protein [Bacteroidota bacterium]